MPSRVGERGQITLEKAIREELGVYAGDLAIQRVENGRVVVEFVPAPHRRSVAGVLKDRVRRRPDDERWDDGFVAQYPNAAAFLEMIKDPEYQRAVVNRTAALADSRLVRFAPRAVGEGF